MSDPAASAVAHAEALGHTIAELLRFSREGPSTPRYPFGLEDISAILAESLLFVLRTEVAAIAVDPEADTSADREEAETGSQMCAALVKWLTEATGVPVED